MIDNNLIPHLCKSCEFYLLEILIKSEYCFILSRAKNNADPLKHVTTCSKYSDDLSFILDSWPNTIRIE